MFAGKRASKFCFGEQAWREFVTLAAARAAARSSGVGVGGRWYFMLGMVRFGLIRRAMRRNLGTSTFHERHETDKSNKGTYMKRSVTLKQQGS